MTKRELLALANQYQEQIIKNTGRESVVARRKLEVVSLQLELLNDLEQVHASYCSDSKIQELRTLCGADQHRARNALIEAEGDVAKAKQILWFGKI